MEDKKQKKQLKKGKNSQSQSERSGLTFPVSRVRKNLKNGEYARYIGKTSAVYLAGVLEYLTAELLELAGEASKIAKKQRIAPRHIQLAIRNDEELSILCKDVIISDGGVMPYIHPILLPAMSRKKNAAGKNNAEKDKDDKNYDQGAGPSSQNY